MKLYYWPLRGWVFRKVCELQQGRSVSAKINLQGCADRTRRGSGTGSHFNALANAIWYIANAELVAERILRGPRHFQGCFQRTQRS
jgi:hypothetical protein